MDDEDHELDWESLVQSAEESWTREDAMLDQGAAETKH